MEEQLNSNLPPKCLYKGQFGQEGKKKKKEITSEHLSKLQMTLCYPRISSSYLISSTFNQNAPGTNVAVKESKVVEQRVFLCGDGRREETQVPGVRAAY